jgi:hypothetical protein
VNKLDTDETFLRAVNSTKRGKKLEDDFDREFNLLRITKPKKADGVGAATVAAGAPAGVPDVAVAPWDAIDDFGDVGIRGNFMVVVEMDIERGSAKPSQLAHTDSDTTHPEWISRPNFKKFKKVRFVSPFFSFHSPFFFFDEEAVLMDDWATQKSTAAIERRQTIELVISEENDYGIGNGMPFFSLSESCGRLSFAHSWVFLF